MRPLYFLPLLLILPSCSLMKGEKVPKPKFTIFEAARDLQSQSPPPVTVKNTENTGSVPALPSPGKQEDYHLPDVMKQMPEDRELRGGTAPTKPSENMGVIAKPPRE